MIRCLAICFLLILIGTTGCDKRRRAEDIDFFADAKAYVATHGAVPLTET